MDLQKPGEGTMQKFKCFISAYIFLCTDCPVGSRCYTVEGMPERYVLEAAESIGSIPWNISSLTSAL